MVGETILGLRGYMAKMTKSEEVLLEEHGGGFSVGRGRFEDICLLNLI